MNTNFLHNKLRSLLILLFAGLILSVTILACQPAAQINIGETEIETEGETPFDPNDDSDVPNYISKK